MPNKRRTLGQHMLVDHKVLAKIVDAAGIDKSETVCEVGTGQGILTAELCRRAQWIISFEIDRELFRNAQEQLKFNNLELANADLFKTAELHFDVFVSNLPYSRSRDAFEWLAVRKFSRAIVMVQEEFADKLTATPGDKKYRAISVLASYCFKIEKLFKVQSKSFEPQPLVESAVLRIIPIRTITNETIKNVNLLFSKRNKKASTVAAKAGIQADLGNMRINQLAADDLVKMAESIQHVRPI
ncbi:MAG TPA: 16S rRNA (adenine(1518)-N(6)/adenine(1519)-N(6))-dimethyltransferase RsmA [Nitrososphaera sp.]|nr:16S rRNA (adenine(1518)-N(6)/adenine(1519)-N(6))-dimethyltransferase RsmA [Nitrososphaera sp.]